MDVVHAEHAPIGIAHSPIRVFNDTQCSTGLCGIQLPFTSTDVDATFSSTTYYRISTFPLLGELYQIGNPSTLDGSVATIITSLTGLQLISSTSSTTFAWAQAVMRVSSQFSNCGPDCYYLETCPPSCTDVAFTVNNILGAVDIYPEWSSSPLAWGGAFAYSHEWVELDYGEHMYVTSIEVYEVWVTGVVVKLSVASDYNDEDTEWTTLWESTIGPSIPGSRSRVFSPSLCACLTPVRYLRVELDSRYGWPGNVIALIKRPDRSRTKLTTNECLGCC
jgi:hypothetical protein